MNKQVVSYSEACDLFNQHCDVIFMQKHIEVFDQKITIIDIVQMLKKTNRNLYNDVLFKWCADIGLHIT